MFISASGFALFLLLIKPLNEAYLTYNLSCSLPLPTPLPGKEYFTFSRVLASILINLGVILVSKPEKLRPLK